MYSKPWLFDILKFAFFLNESWAFEIAEWFDYLFLYSYLPQNLLDPVLSSRNTEVNKTEF